MSYDRRERSSSGELRWVRITLFPDREPGGKTGGAFVVINDIEDDVRIREALKSQEAQLRLFADNIPGPIAYLDKKLKYTFVNQAFANWVRRPQDQIYGKTPYDIMPHDVNSFLRPIITRAQEGENVEYERVGVSADGQRRWMHGRIAPDLDATGKVRGLYCTGYDIHDLKLTEQALATREEQLRLFTDNIPEPVVYVDMEGNYTFVNDAFLHLSRHTARGSPREIGQRGARARSLRAAAAVRRSRGQGRERHLRARTHRYQWSAAMASRQHLPGHELRRDHQGLLHRRPRHHRPAAGAERARRARDRSCGRSWTASRRRWPISIATSAVSTSTGHFCSISA